MAAAKIYETYKEKPKNIDSGSNCLKSVDHRDFYFSAAKVVPNTNFSQDHPADPCLKKKLEDLSLVHSDPNTSQLHHPQAVFDEDD